MDFYKRVAIRRPGPVPPLCISTSRENDSASKQSPIENPSPSEVEKVFKKIEDRLFRGRTKALKIFELFDVDKDGSYLITLIESSNYFQRLHHS